MDVLCPFLLAAVSSPRMVWRTPLAERQWRRRIGFGTAAAGPVRRSIDRGGDSTSREREGGRTSRAAAMSRAPWGSSARSRLPKIRVRVAPPILKCPSTADVHQCHPTPSALPPQQRCRSPVSVNTSSARLPLFLGTTISAIGPAACQEPVTASAPLLLAAPAATNAPL